MTTVLSVFRKVIVNAIAAPDAFVSLKPSAAVDVRMASVKLNLITGFTLRFL
ncbi:hypothetical protein D9M68_553020 [compost metagenome]